ncbi:enkurin domain-containing protein 1 [Trichonephila inaurata madagascariensis]|uniref:Enkurin domain-containing protein 1 n=1 Tax=Trichonephila inaurata madagascariensis TaxID=2747483 RepID=A0A8X7CIE1_9ARAC|nr:enkurin domain-containing protein 1 [Trichonephila inaurata madagascariensis]
MRESSRNCAMECEVPQRPHTVGALPKVCVQSELIMTLLQEIENEARGPILRPHLPQKNYMKENLKRLKEIQAQSKKKIAEKQPLKPLRVPNHYHEVQPKILRNVPFNQDKGFDNPPKTAGPFRSKPPLSPCLRPKSERISTAQQYRSLPDLNNSEGNEQNLDGSDKDLKSPRSDIESEKSFHSAIRSKKKSETKTEVRHRLGQIPNYLTERKKQWEMEKERQLKLREEASIPQGYTLLPDEERIETLELLKKNQEEIIQSLAALPVRNDTVRLRNYKEELERQLAKVEEGIKIFSRPKVLIKNDT